MQMSGYELLYIVSSTKNDDELKEVMIAVSEVLAKSGAVFLSHEPWSKRRLAYKIGGIEHGAYILAYFTADESALGGIVTALKHTAHVARSIILKHNDINAARSAFFEYYEEMKNKCRPLVQGRYAQPRPVAQLKRPLPVKQAEATAIVATIKGRLESQGAEIVAERIQEVDGVQVEEASRKDMPTAVAKESEKRNREDREPIKTKERPRSSLERKHAKKPTLEELDKKLAKILEGEIEL